MSTPCSKVIEHLENPRSDRYFAVASSARQVSGQKSELSEIFGHACSPSTNIPYLRSLA